MRTEGTDVGCHPVVPFGRIFAAVCFLLFQGNLIARSPFGIPLFRYTAIPLSRADYIPPIWLNLFAYIITLKECEQYLNERRVLRRASFVR